MRPFHLRQQAVDGRFGPGDGPTGSAPADIAEQCPTGIRNAVGQHPQVVAPLQRHDQPAAAQAVGQGDDGLRQAPVAGQGEPQPCQWVIPVRVIAGRDQDQLRPEALGHRRQDFIVGTRKARIAHTGRQRHVDRIPLPRVPPGLPPIPGAGVIRVLVRREEEHCAES